VARRYQTKGYWTSELLGDLLDPWATEYASRPALVSDAGVTTYRQLDDFAHSIASGLQRLGVHAGDRVVVQLPNSVELVAIMLALFRLGALPVFAQLTLRRHEISYLCDHTQAIAYIIPGVHQSFDFLSLAADVCRNIPNLRHVISTGASRDFVSLKELTQTDSVDYPKLDAGEVAFFLLSGGTTGTPKLIPRTHRDYGYQLRATSDAVGGAQASIYLAALSIGHNAALGCPGVLGTLRAGGKVVLAGSPTPAEVFPLIQREGVTLTTLMPSILKLWVEMVDILPADLSKVLFQIGGAQLDPEVGRQVYSKLGARLTHWFGMAEGFLCYTRLDDQQDVVVHSCGRPLCVDDEIRVVDETGTDVRPGATGELLVRGPYTLRGYYKDDDYNRSVFTSDGYLCTGDLVHITPRGGLVVEGRIKDIVNRGGEKVPAEELEQKLIAHPAVRDAAVIAMPDAAMVEKTWAFIVARHSPPVLGEIHRFLRESGLAEYKLPDYVETVDSLPYTNLGKVNKRLLRELAADVVMAKRDRKRGVITGHD
jgi:2,3-dihydroxybenzoate-AMP ligase